jgi:hypothetical protein
MFAASNRHLGKSAAILDFVLTNVCSFGTIL